MSLDPDLEELMNQTVTYEPFASQDQYGVRSYGAAKTVKARIEQVTRRVTSQQGSEVASNTQVYLKPQATDASSIVPTHRDRITLPAGFAPQQPPILSIDRHMDVDATATVHHFQVNL